MANEIIEFYAEDGVILNGYINKGNKKIDKVLIEMHGMTSNCFKKREKIIADFVENIGIDSIYFNNRGSDIVEYIKYKDDKILKYTKYNKEIDFARNTVKDINYIDGT